MNKEINRITAVKFLGQEKVYSAEKIFLTSRDGVRRQSDWCVKLTRRDST